MTHAISHRGPDDEGIYLDGAIGLGSSRLSIIDIPGGAQPISNEDGSLWIVFNGEIYNYQTLRNQLIESNHKFTTQSDTEVVLHLYEELGPASLNLLRGMFAFAVWDSRKQELFIARDRIGQKPLYYCQHQGGFYFGSEIKAIVALEDIPREMDRESVYHYLSLRFIPSPNTMFRHIKKIPPAHYLTYVNGKVEVSRYWDLRFDQKESASSEQLLLGLEEKLGEVVESHLVSDVPVGAFLSGGLDSSIVVALMNKAVNERFKTFSIGVNDQSFNELPFAKQVAEHVGSDHHEEWVRFNLIQELPQMIWHLDEPSDPIAACMYKAAELAARHVKVVMGGDGGDELFAGFDRYLGVQYLDYYNLIPSLLRDRLIGPMISSAPENFTYKSWTQKARWMHDVGSVTDESARYAAATTFFRFSDAEKELLLRGGSWQDLIGHNSSRIISDVYNQAPATSMLDRMLYTDIMTRLPEHSLMLTDRMTMAHGLEARSPLLDHELMEYLARFPAETKIKNGQLKSILRHLAKDYLPGSIVQRNKQGFMFPIADWFRGPLFTLLKETLINSAFINQGIFDQAYIESLLEEHRNSQVDHHVRLWMLLNLEFWHQIYIDGIEPSELSESVGRVYATR